MMDKSWINAHIKSITYRKGVESFINFARARDIRGSIICPCLRCCNDELLEVDEVHEHLLRYGFLPGYTIWTIHGELATPPTSPSTSVHETSFVEDDMIGLVRDAFGLSSFPSNHENTEEAGLDGEVDESAETSDHNVEDIPYKKLLEQCDKELYPGCKFSSLSFTLRLYHIKCIGGISNKTFGMLLELLRDAFPHITSLPSSVNQTKKLTNDLGLGYKKIHACPNDCMLYWDKSEGEQSCHTCKASRYRDDVGDQSGESSKSHKSKKPAKVLRYFPLIPRLKRLYMCEKTAKDMRWHDTGRTKDGKLRHPADGLAWKAFNDRYEQFASDPRSVRLGLASDGCNPFCTMSTSHSTWPVLLIPYNLPPWICMKQQSFILSAIIEGEKGPGNDIDVYLQPLIKELNLLWKGVDAYDAFSKERFKLRASLLWTVNDFPAYANLSGWSTKGRVGCPTCVKSTRSLWLKHGKKFCYMGHRRWLEENHPYRFQKDRFDGTIERDDEDEYEDEDQIDEDEAKEVEIVDEYGSILRTQKMTAKDVYKLSEGEKVLVHVNDTFQLIKGATTVCTRFMTLLLRQPNLCPPEAKDWREIKARCGVLLLGELRRKFSLPQLSGVDDVLFAMFGGKVRYTKYRFKMKLFRLAAQKLDEANNVGINGAQEGTYTEDELLQALDLIDAPPNFLHHQWELYKSNLRTPMAKKLSQQGKKAKSAQIHTHRTGATSFARKRDRFKTKYKREPNRIESFDLSYQSNDGSYIHDMSREFRERAREETNKRELEMGNSRPVDDEARSEIADAVMFDLIGPDKPGQAFGFGTGVTKSKVTKFSFDLRRARKESLMDQNRLLLEKVESQGRHIESQNNQMKIMAKDLSDLKEEVKFLTTALKELYGAGAYKDMIFEDVPSTQEHEKQHEQQQHHHQKQQEQEQQHHHQNHQVPLAKMWQNLWQTPGCTTFVSRVE